MATPDGEPHGKETHRLADTFSSCARGEYVNFQLVQEVCVRVCVCVCVVAQHIWHGECHRRSPVQSKRECIQCF